jgi:TM2 domain-containing membrane protein YozV
MPYPYGAVHPCPARPLKSSGAAVALELVPGIFGIFGIGNIYAGRVGAGIALMVGFWALFWVNVLLVFLIIGWITAPLTWIAFMIVGAVSAARGAERHNVGH